MVATTAIDSKRTQSRVPEQRINKLPPRAATCRVLAYYRKCEMINAAADVSPPPPPALLLLLLSFRTSGGCHLSSIVAHQQPTWTLAVLTTLSWAINRHKRDCGIKCNTDPAADTAALVCIAALSSVQRHSSPRQDCKHVQQEEQQTAQQLQHTQRHWTAAVAAQKTGRKAQLSSMTSLGLLTLWSAARVRMQPVMYFA